MWGGAAQSPILRSSVGTLRLDYAQFIELEAFTRFGGLPDTHVRQQLARGACIRAILRQGPHAPLDLLQEVALVTASQNGLLDGVPAKNIRTIQSGLGDYLRSNASEISTAIESGGVLSAEQKERFVACLRQYVEPPASAAS
ncbi:hypothetical protein [Gluconobacter oxydans]|uniref:hypothetical protein n=1 Tax=Gluconobacter oxydans TaxID=442 RepID=UPI0039E9C2D9